MRRRHSESPPNAFRLPDIWRRPTVLLASFGINLLGLALPMVILQVYDRIIPDRAIETFGFLMAGLVTVIVLETALRVLRSTMLSWESARFDHRKSLRAMNRILGADTLAFEDRPTGFYLDKIHALEQIQEFYSSPSILLLMDFPFVVIYMALIWVIDGPLLLIPMALLALFALASFVTGRRLQEALTTRSTVEDRRQNFIIETLRGIHTIKSMAMEPFMMRRYEKLQHQSALSVYELSRTNSVVQGIGASFSQLAVVSFVGIGSLYVIDGSLSIGALAAGSMLSSRVLQPGLRAMGIWTQFQSVRLARRKVETLFSLPLEQGGELRPQGGIRGQIELRNVHFRYPSQEQELLRGISLTIRPNESIALMGPNGAGKSTLMGLLSGFLHPDRGEILLDGHNIRDYDLEYLRAQIGIVPQKGTLFDGSILENMTLYREGEAIDQAIELAQLLGLDEIVTRLPDGLDTQVGGAAVDTLSAGVRQKIVMVRSLVGFPPVVLFDDANANFDIQNDRKLLSLMGRLKGRHTLIIVSHRPSFLRLCDRQLLIEDGRLKELGARRPETGTAGYRIHQRDPAAVRATGHG